MKWPAPLDFQLNLLRELHFRDYEARSSGHPLPPGYARVVMSTGRESARLDRTGPLSPGAVPSDQRDQPDAPSRFGTGGTDIELLAEAFRAPLCPQNSVKPSRASQGMPSTSCKNTTGRATSVSSKPRFNERSPFATVHGSPRAICRLSSITIGRRACTVGSGTPRPHLKMGVRPLKEALVEPEKRIIIQALQAFNWNRQETARVLDINRTTLYKKMKKYNLLIDEPAWANN